MDKEQLQQLFVKLMDIFHGLMEGNISYSFDNLNMAMKTDIGEVFDAVAGEVVMKIYGDHSDQVTEEELRNLKSNLHDFGEEYSVGEVKDAIALINDILGEEDEDWTDEDEVDPEYELDVFVSTRLNEAEDVTGKYENAEDYMDRATTGTCFHEGEGDEEKLWFKIYVDTSERYGYDLEGYIYKGNYYEPDGSRMYSI